MQDSIIADAQETAPNRPERLAIPGPGRTLSAVAEERGQHLRAAAQLIEGALAKTDSGSLLRAFLPLQDNLIQVASTESPAIRCAWALVNVWLLARKSGELEPHESLADAERWFFGKLQSKLPSIAAHIPEPDRRKAEECLAKVSFDGNFRDLLPYLLEPHGPGSRLSVMRDASTLSARRAKKERGVFYTPIDVAEYMIRQTLDTCSSSPATQSCIDPACGTGVFLATLLHEITLREECSPLDYATQNLFGFDISALAVESCVFVLLSSCIYEVRERRIIPWKAWQRLRLNFAVLDSLVVSVGNTPNSTRNKEREGLQSALLAAGSRALPAPVPISSVKNADERIALYTLFAEVGAGFDLLIGNPPYAALGDSPHQSFIRENFASLAGAKITGAENIYTIFVELMWRLTKAGQNASALVVPLSIAYSQKNQFRQCRQAMSYFGGRWSFAFFDREPHALFGEDVKTRNAIVFRRECPSDPARGRAAEIHTGPMRKWTSRSRERLFRTIDFTPLGNASIGGGLPKVGNPAQARAYLSLTSRLALGGPLWTAITTSRTEEALNPAELNRLFVGGTAYNFLNVFRSLSASSRPDSLLSESGLHCIECPSGQIAEVAFSVLSSRLAFWLWHVEGDGFHVSRNFIERFPFGSGCFSDAQIDELRQLGADLWRDLQAHQIVSVNKGKTSFAFRPLACEGLRDRIARILIQAAGLPKSFEDDLRSFVRQVVVVDETDGRRERAMEFFIREDTNDY